MKYQASCIAMSLESCVGMLMSELLLLDHFHKDDSCLGIVFNQKSWME